MSPRRRTTVYTLGPRQVSLLADLRAADRSILMRDEDRASCVRLADRGLVTMRGSFVEITAAGRALL